MKKRIILLLIVMFLSGCNAIDNTSHVENNHEQDVEIEIPNYSIQHDITIDTYTGYDIHDFVTADEGVEISSSLNEETSILSIHLEKDLWKVDIDKEVTLINSNPYPITYSIVSNHNTSTMSPDAWQKTWGAYKLIVLNENEVVFDRGEEPEKNRTFLKDEDGVYSYVSKYEDAEGSMIYTFTLTFNDDKAHINVDTRSYYPNGDVYPAPALPMYYNFVKDDNNIENK